MTDREDELRRLAAEIADGRTPDWSSHEGDARERANLKKLQHLSAVFANARGEADGTAPGGGEFRWCHLQVLEPIGRGGFGEVFRAFDPVLDREVALKLRRRGGDDNQTIVEARRLARVRHPNVLAVHGADVDGGRAGIWTDLLQGQTLEEAFTIGARPGQDRLLSICLDLTAALCAIHQQHLIHGDVKAANVMLQPDGTPVLMDFGAAGEQASPGGSPTAGSPLVMAPELLEGQPASDRSDVYSLGVLFYRLYGGDYPLSAETMESLRQAHRGGVRPDFASIPRSLRALVRSMLAPAAEQRPAAIAVLHHLRHLALAPQRRRQRRATAVVLGALALAAGALGAGFFKARESARDAREAQASSQQALEFLTDMLSAPRGSREGSEVRVLEVLDAARSNLAFSPPASTRQHATLAHTLGITYASLGQYETSDDLLNEALTLWRSRGDELRLPRMQTQLAVAANHVAQSRAAQAIEQLQPLVAALDENLGHEAAVKAEALFRLGAAYFQQGDQALGMRFSDEALALARRVEAPGDLPGLIAADQAQNLLRTDLAAAEQKALLARQWLAQSNSPGSSNLVRAGGILTMVYMEQGRFSEAQTLIEDTLPLARVHTGATSRDSTQLLSLLSVALGRQGKDDRALAVQREVLENTIALYGEVHLSTARMHNNLAIRLQDLGRHDGAHAAYEASIAILLELVGAEHPQTLMTRGNQAENLLQGGNLEAAEATARATLEVNRQTLGEDHMVTLFVRDVLGAALTRRGQPAEALPILRESWRRKTDTVGPDNPYTHDSAYFLAESLIALDEPAEAAKLLTGVLENRRRDLGEDHPKTQKALELLARTTIAD